MARLKSLVIILIIAVIYIFQSSFFSGSNTFLVNLNLIMIIVIWLSFVNSPWRWLFAIFGGWLLDLQQGTFGVNLITLVCLSGLVIVLRKYIATTTGRSGQFMVISITCLIIGIFLPYFLNLLLKILINSQALFNWLNYGSPFVWYKLLQYIMVNFVLLLLIHVFYLRRIKQLI
ncbi:hypothetical protein KKF32_05015 [Patescibacteria group bacterium]|nr:hypothetical protein [Patescibacteria group bacterium]